MRANIGSGGQGLCRSETGAFCQKWRNNEKSLVVSPLPLSQAVGRPLPIVSWAGSIGMIRRWLKFLMVIVVSIVSLWGAILGFGNPFDCVWPSLDELMVASRLPELSVVIGLEDQAGTQLEAAVADSVSRRGASHIRFTPGRDFIEHALPRSPQVWRYEDGELVPVDENVARRAMQSPVDMAAFLSGDYPRIFRFAVLHAETAHACVIVEIEESAGGMNYFDFWYVFRPGFGLGPWWVVSEGGVFFGW